MTPPAVLLTAAWLDVLLGEPRRAHPVRLFGVFLDRVRRLRTARPTRDRLLGAAALAAGGAGAALATVAADRLTRRAPPALAVLLQAIALKPTFAVRALLEAGDDVRTALAANDLDSARLRLGTHLVSRPVDDLAHHEVAAATIESLAENLTDAVVAPFLFAATVGPGAAWAYRFVNTADAVLGYRTVELRHLGEVPARVDDVLNLLPARLGAVLIGLAAPAGGGDTNRALRTALRERTRTASPNAGWTMAAMAGALGVSLSKRGAYTLNPSGRAPTPADIGRAERIVAAASGLALALASVIGAATTRRRRR